MGKDPHFNQSKATLEDNNSSRTAILQQFMNEYKMAHCQTINYTNAINS